MGTGIGSLAHNRVAGAGIEPASRGYEPREVPLLYPAICGYTSPLSNALQQQAEINERALDRLKLAKDRFVTGNGTVGERVRKRKSRSLVRDLIADLVDVPCILKRMHFGRIDGFELLADAVAYVAEAGEHVIEHDVCFDNRFPQMTRIAVVQEPLDVFPAWIDIVGRDQTSGRRDQGAVIDFLATAQFEKTHGYIHDHSEPENREQVADNHDPEPNMRGERRKRRVAGYRMRAGRERVERLK